MLIAGTILSAQKLAELENPAEEDRNCRDGNSECGLCPRSRDDFALSSSAQQLATRRQPVLGFAES
jgi:hypothetical protein